MNLCIEQVNNLQKNLQEELPKISYQLFKNIKKIIILFGINCTSNWQSSAINFILVQWPKLISSLIEHTKKHNPNPVAEVQKSTLYLAVVMFFLVLNLNQHVITEYSTILKTIHSLQFKSNDRRFKLIRTSCKKTYLYPGTLYKKNHKMKKYIFRDSLNILYDFMLKIRSIFIAS